MKKQHEFLFYLAALFSSIVVVPVGIWKVDVTRCFHHNFLYVVASLPNNVRMFRVRYIHLQGHPQTLVWQIGMLTLAAENESRFGESMPNQLRIPNNYAQVEGKLKDN